MNPSEKCIHPGIPWSSVVKRGQAGGNLIHLGLLGATRRWAPVHTSRSRPDFPSSLDAISFIVSLSPLQRVSPSTLNVFKKSTSLLFYAIWFPCLATLCPRLWRSSNTTCPRPRPSSSALALDAIQTTNTRPLMLLGY